MEFNLFQSNEIKVNFRERDLLEVIDCIRIHGRASKFLVKDQDFHSRIHH